MNICFKNIRVISPAQKLDDRFDLWIKSGKIHYLDKQEAKTDPDTRIVDGKNLVASPGLYDMHVHFREPGYEYKEDINTGAMSAANGGFTGVCMMPNTDPVTDNAEVLEFINNKTKGKLVDIHSAAAITKGLQGTHITTMLELEDYGAVMFTDDGRCVMSSEVMKRAFDYAATRDLLISQHCEDHNLTKDFAMNEGEISGRLGLKGFPSVAEDMIISRDIMLLEYCGNRRYHPQHVSTKGAVALVRDAKARGLRVSTEATPHHFVLDEEVMKSYGPEYKMCPPLRTKGDIEAIKAGLKDGTIDCIASDHAPHAYHEKDVELEKAPNGIIGLETSLGLSLTHLVHGNVLSLSELIEKMSVNPRKLLKLAQIEIASGENANLSIFAPDEEWNVDKKLLRSKSKNTPFDGFKLRGKPKYTINNNKIHECKL